MPKKLLAALLVVTFCTGLVWAAEPTVKIDSYSKDHIPDWLSDLRQSEIVTLGSLPFVTMNATLVYTLVRYFAKGFDANYMPTLFAKSSAAANLSTDEQVGIIITAASISLAIGIADFVISRIDRSKEKRAAEEEQERIRENIEVIEVTIENTGGE